jgi:MFS transporter, PAT family, beta-lactamase induction signal transducer AmpG
MSFPRRLAVLSALYLAQGLPFGFQSFALPIFLRRQGVSLTAIGFLGALSLPWLLKPIWAPLVDRFGRTRRAWIVPLMAILAATCAAAALPDPSTRVGLAMLLGLVFTMNLVAATQDIAVDGLAIDLLGPKELGGGNTAQVVGYKFGILVGGQLFVFLGVMLRWPVLFVGMAGLVLVALAATFFVEERPRHARGENTRIADVVTELGRALVLPGSGALIAFIATYKIGESLAEIIWKPWIVDVGFSDDFIGGAFGVTGIVTSIVGSLAGGWLATRYRPERAVWVPAAGRILPLLGQAMLAARGASAGSVLVVTTVGLEHLFGGALTTVVFALMMSRVDKKIGATHYTALAAIEVLGKYPGGFVAGPIAQHAGYSTAFLIAAALTAVQLVTVPALRAGAPSRPGPSPSPDPSAAGSRAPD